MKIRFKILSAVFLFAVTALSDDKKIYETDTTISGIEFVLVKAGTFMMGSPKNESGRSIDETQFQVTLTYNYRISRYPVTQAQYREFTGSRPSIFGERDSNPVEHITWDNADEFAKSIGGRLPTEAEWEFAARGGNRGAGYLYSGGDNLDSTGWYSDNILTESTQSVGQKSANRLGIYDMSGNVWEWCGDWYGSYPKGFVKNPKGPDSGIERVVRGGAWDSRDLSCRVANRGSAYPLSGYNNVGFRVVLPAK